MSATSNRPSQPVTGEDVEDGYDSMLWLWVFALEVGMHALSARLEYLIKRVAGGSGSLASGYEGPWMVAKDKNGDWQLLDGTGDTPSAPNFISLGSWSTSVAATKVSPSAGGYVYLDVTCASGAYSVAVKSGVMPSQSADHFYIPIVYWYRASGSTADPEPIRCQYGDISFPGRLF